MARESRTQDGGLRLAPESVEAIARRLADLLRNAEPQHLKGLIPAAKVAEWWGVDRSWVYAHAEELGVRRLGGGRRPRLRFDPEEVAERMAGLAASAAAESLPAPSEVRRYVR